jgi:hypothetical protein
MELQRSVAGVVRREQRRTRGGAVGLAGRNREVWKAQQSRLSRAPDCQRRVGQAARSAADRPASAAGQTLWFGFLKMGGLEGAAVSAFPRPRLPAARRTGRPVRSGPSGECSGANTMVWVSEDGQKQGKVVVAQTAPVAGVRGGSGGGGAISRRTSQPGSPQDGANRPPRPAGGQIDLQRHLTSPKPSIRTDKDQARDARPPALRLAPSRVVELTEPRHLHSYTRQRGPGPGVASAVARRRRLQPTVLSQIPTPDPPPQPPTPTQVQQPTSTEAAACRPLAWRGPPRSSSSCALPSAPRSPPAPRRPSSAPAAPSFRVR